MLKASEFKGIPVNPTNHLNCGYGYNLFLQIPLHQFRSLYLQLITTWSSCPNHHRLPRFPRKKPVLSFLRADRLSTTCGFGSNDGASHTMAVAPCWVYTVNKDSPYAPMRVRMLALLLMPCLHRCSCCLPEEYVDSACPLCLLKHLKLKVCLFLRNSCNCRGMFYSSAKADEVDISNASITITVLIPHQAVWSRRYRNLVTTCL